MRLERASPIVFPIAASGMHRDAPLRSPVPWLHGRFVLVEVTTCVLPRRRAQQSSALKAGFTGGCSPQAAADRNRSFSGSWMKSLPKVPGSSRGAWMETVAYTLSPGGACRGR